MIKVRKIYTKEMHDKFRETGVLTDEALIAYLDTYFALTKLLDYPIFSAHCTTCYINSSDIFLKAREAEIKNVSKEFELVINQIPSNELISVLTLEKEEHYLTDIPRAEKLQFIEYCNTVLDLTDFDIDYFYTLRFFMVFMKTTLLSELRAQGFTE